MLKYFSVAVLAGAAMADPHPLNCAATPGFVDDGLGGCRCVNPLLSVAYDGHSCMIRSAYRDARIAEIRRVYSLEANRVRNTWGTPSYYGYGYGW